MLRVAVEGVAVECCVLNLFWLPLNLQPELLLSIS